MSAFGEVLLPWLLCSHFIKLCVYLLISNRTGLQSEPELLRKRGAERTSTVIMTEKGREQAGPGPAAEPEHSKHKEPQ